MITTTVKNILLGALGNYVASVGAHTEYPGTGGATGEVTGGSPAYARKAFTWASASGGVRAMAASVDIDIPASTDVTWLSFWVTEPVGGTSYFAGMVPNGGTPQRYATDVAGDTILCSGHGLVDTDTIAFFGGTAPGGLTLGTTYFVVSASTDDFQVAATSGGAAITLTSVQAGQAYVSALTTTAFAAQGTLTVSALSVSLNL